LFQLRKNYFGLLLLIILGLFHIKYGLIPAWNNINSDFPNYYTSSRLIIEKNNLSQIYNNQWFQSQIYRYGINEQGKFAPFPPPTIFIMMPIANFNPLTAKRIFLIINIITLITTAYMFRKISLFSFIACVDIILFSGVALINNFMFGQLYLLLLLVTVSGYYYLISGKDHLVGFLWGVGAAIKYFPVILIPVLVIKKRWKALGWLMGTVIIINLITILIIGWGVYNQFLSQVLFSHLNGNLKGQSDFAVQLQSWNSLLRDLFIFDQADNKYPLINSPLIFNIVRILIYTLFTGITALTIYKNRNDDRIYTYSTALLTVLLLLVSPASATYHLLLLSFPLVLLLSINNKPIPDKYGIFLIAIYVLTGFFPFIINKLSFITVIPYIYYHHLWLLLIFFVVSVVNVSAYRKKGLHGTS
jgi:hypothetical protein